MPRHRPCEFHDTSRGCRARPSGHRKCAEYYWRAPLWREGTLAPSGKASWSALRFEVLVLVSIVTPEIQQYIAKLAYR